MSWFSSKQKNIESYPYFKLEVEKGYVRCSLCRFPHALREGKLTSKVFKNKTYTLFTCAYCNGTYCYNIVDNTCLLTESINKDSNKPDFDAKKAEHDADRLSALENKIEELYLLLDKYKISRY